MFQYCSSLASIIIPDNVERIESAAFSYCSSLNDIQLPNSVTYIGVNAFEQCTGLESIIIPENVTQIECGAFSECSNLNHLYYNAIKASVHASTWGNSFPATLKEVQIGLKVKTIPHYFLYGCSLIESITIPRGVTAIGNNAFYGCSKLSSVTNLSKTPQSIGSSVFSVTGTLHVLPGYAETYKKQSYWKNFTIVEDAIDNSYKDITLGASDYSTYCSDANLDFSEVDGLKAYIASSFNPSTGALTITRVDNVPAGEGILLKGTAGESYEVPATDETSVVANLMVGTTTATTLYPTDGDKTNFVLTRNAEDQMGFYRFSGSVNMPANKAWLQIPTSAISSGVAAKGFTFIEEGDEITGITDVVMSNENREGMFDLQGRKLTASPASGIYIMNGKKYVK